MCGLWAHELLVLKSVLACHPSELAATLPGTVTTEVKAGLPPWVVTVFLLAIEAFVVATRKAPIVAIVPSQTPILPTILLRRPVFDIYHLLRHHLWGHLLSGYVPCF